MNTYEWYGQKFRAWSEMACANKEDHQPHRGCWEYTMYGPYYCAGVNPVPPYVPKHRKEDA